MLTLLKVLGVALAIALMIYAAFFTRLLEIQKIDIEGSAETLDEQSAINDYLKDHLGKNMLMFNSIKHEDILIQDYPHLKELRITRIPLHTIRATLETYEHVTNVEIRHDNGDISYYVVNELGYIASIGTLEESLPTLVMDVTGTDLESFAVNEELIPQTTLEDLLSAGSNFEGKFNMQVLEMHYLKRARELHLLTERNFFVWIDLEQDINLQLAKLKKAMASLNIYEENLEYIDLRISGQNGEKVIYKTRSET